MYTPNIPTSLSTPEDIRLYLGEELRNIALEMQQIEIAQFRVLHVEPARRVDGMVVYADGTNWNPGSGAGLYERVAGAWVKLVPANVFNELVDDRVDALIQDGTGITWVYNDIAGTLTPTVTITQYTDELAQDAAASLIQNGTGITWSYNDGANTLTPTVTLAPFSTTDLAEGSNLYFTNERAQDAVGGILTDSASIDFTYDDAANTITAIIKSDYILPVVNGGSGVSAIPAFSVHRNNSDQTAIADSTWTKIQFTTEEFDTNNNFDNATNYRFTPTVAGKYIISFHVGINSIGDGARVLASIYKNGSEFKTGLGVPNGTGSNAGVSVTAVIDFNGSSDYVEFYVLHTHGSNRDVFGSSLYTYATGIRSGP